MCDTENIGVYVYACMYIRYSIGLFISQVEHFLIYFLINLSSSWIQTSRQHPAHGNFQPLQHYSTTVQRGDITSIIIWPLQYLRCKYLICVVYRRHQEVTSAEPGPAVDANVMRFQFVSKYVALEPGRSSKDNRFPCAPVGSLLH